ncbi:hypothetical protein MYAM1_003321 [Malassezia yamatoensis]|uniref:Uncharacterized protein n=1 Tax=Malassezia yamatoensis TaxID=253288 RepID=A0AAJ5Z1H7_9BASI|nr:hypothetical protein MYAM1_003321 [Malassezia yamatoensis]
MQEDNQASKRVGALSKKASRSPGPGKQPKKFTEDQGMSHLLALSKQAVDKTDDEYQHRIDRTHAVQEKRQLAEKEKRKKKQEAKSTSTKPTRSTMVALLREKHRQKSRERRERRHAERQATSARVSESKPDSMPRSSEPRRSILKSSKSRSSTTPQKSVSFH